MMLRCTIVLVGLLVHCYAYAQSDSMVTAIEAKVQAINGEQHIRTEVLGSEKYTKPNFEITTAYYNRHDELLKVKWYAAIDENVFEVNYYYNDDKPIYVSAASFKFFYDRDNDCLDTAVVKSMNLTQYYFVNREMLLRNDDGLITQSGPGYKQNEETILRECDMYYQQARTINHESTGRD